MITATDDQLVDAAIERVKLLPISLSERTAIALAAVAVSQSRDVDFIISSIVERWAETQMTAFQNVQQISAQRLEASIERIQQSAERKAMKPTIRLAVLQRDGHRCKSCGASASDSKLHVDHIVAVSKGGKTDLSNLQTLCDRCNLAKAARSIEIPGA